VSALTVRPSQDVARESLAHGRSAADRDEGGGGRGGRAHSQQPGQGEERGVGRAHRDPLAATRA